MRCLLELFPSGTVLLRFASKVPTWSLPVLGHVAALFHVGVGSAADAESQYGDGGVHWVSSSGPGRKKNSTKQKKTSTPR